MPSPWYPTKKLPFTSQEPDVIEALPVEFGALPRMAQFVSRSAPEMRTAAESPSWSPTTKSPSGWVTIAEDSKTNSPARTVVPPSCDAVVLAVRVPLPVFTNPPAPEVDPSMPRSKPFVSMVPVSLKIQPRRSSAMVPASCSVAPVPLKVTELVSAPSVCLRPPSPARSVPALIMVPPVKVLFPWRTSVPLPSFSSAPAPAASRTVAASVAVVDESTSKRPAVPSRSGSPISKMRVLNVMLAVVWSVPPLLNSRMRPVPRRPRFSTAEITTFPPETNVVPS